MLRRLGFHVFRSLLAHFETFYCPLLVLDSRLVSQEIVLIQGFPVPAVIAKSLFRSLFLHHPILGHHGLVTISLGGGFSKILNHLSFTLAVICCVFVRFLLEFAYFSR